eukprot:CAMPEP_0177731920 /NCGR_PEP_ID=MMETSP0484_2-20121128/22820_1 /TAXON_ID=354590 /ORGANISM="Rhodomonas lens, Strain RHODO" /LENGTH=182 /DNA_ID=CAMNT_0019245089 /DNA_START=34 /DNA_END=582 /DNA_ORIENTATION=-
MDVHIPDIYVPNVHVNDVHIPDVSIPEIHVADVHIPDIHVNDVSVPDIAVRGMTEPTLSASPAQLAQMQESPASTTELRSMMLSSISSKVEQGHCFADVSCHSNCDNCPKCQCLMTDGRVLACVHGECLCEENCLCEKDDDCPKACGLDYSPDLCGKTFCRSGRCMEPFNLLLDDPEYREPA